MEDVSCTNSCCISSPVAFDECMPNFSAQIGRSTFPTRGQPLKWIVAIALDSTEDMHPLQPFATNTNHCCTKARWTEARTNGLGCQYRLFRVHRLSVACVDGT
eukprot:COSAG05_NODE_4114_length_1667_cov_1.927934_1_plen_103_part_00